MAAVRDARGATRSRGSLQETAVAAGRAAAPESFRVLLHADPVPQLCGANPGVGPEHLLGVADGVVVPCPDGPGLLPAFAGAGAEGAVPTPDFGMVSGIGCSPVILAGHPCRGRGTRAGRRSWGLRNSGCIKRVGV
ncbi:hypothetical protein [Streptomyces europaeiscabiei]|uniref:hypothetical protein n=1 Tax=Streptomyces europaeiscabiei TaxID=146819 RepID=UPI000765A4A3|nr:hypothetical protein [Streptomyces europaeiscabiei]